MKKFTAKELREKLKMKEREIKIFLEYQKLLPELMDNRAQGYVINGETLWGKLERPQGRLNMWLDRKIKNVFEENIDYICLAQKCATQRKDGQNGAIVKNIPYLTLDCAKQVAMMTNNEIGTLVRKHFIICEKKLLEYIEWEKVRNPQKAGYRKLSSALKESYQKSHNGEKPHYSLYAIEANMLNLALFGFKAKTVNAMFDDLERRQTREHFTMEMNSALAKLQVFDEGFLFAGIDYKARKAAIEKYCETNFAETKKEFKRVYSIWSKERVSGQYNNDSQSNQNTK